MKKTNITNHKGAITPRDIKYTKSLKIIDILMGIGTRIACVICCILIWILMPAIILAYIIFGASFTIGINIPVDDDDDDDDEEYELL